MPARHRADGPASTPISQLGSTMSSALASPAVARGGLTLVVSSGLVAGGALSAGAAAPAASAKASGSAAEHRAHLAHLAHVAHRAHVGRHAGAAVHVRSRTVASRSAPRSAVSRATGVIAVASRYLGVPYRYGGSTPSGFDCSGFVQYVYSRLGIRLPRTAQQQYDVTRHIPRSQARPGDLVFFFVGGSVTHVGIFAGGNTMIAAPHTGQVVHRQPIYSADVAFGRV